MNGKCALKRKPQRLTMNPCRVRGRQHGHAVTIDIRGCLADPVRWQALVDSGAR